MIVLSLFDGMACGRVALERAGIPVTKYYASEIDKYAIQIAMKNYPDIIQLGDINNFCQGVWLAPECPTAISKPDLIIGGSPCQGFSFAGKQLAFDDPRSKLFWKYVEIVNYYKPKYFLLENVRMKKEYLQVITDALGVEPICINSALVSAQNRVRYYWTNIPNVTQPEDKGILLKDVGIDGTVGRMTGRRLNAEGKREDYNYSIPTKQRFEPRVDSKSGCLTTVQKDNLVEDWGGLRYFTPIECERLQTLPDNYTEGVSNTQRYKMLGNSWTVDVLAHIFRNIDRGEINDLGIL